MIAKPAMIALDKPNTDPRSTCVTPLARRQLRMRPIEPPSLTTNDGGQRTNARSTTNTVLGLLPTGNDDGR